MSKSQSCLLESFVSFHSLHPLTVCLSHKLSPFSPLSPSPCIQVTAESSLLGSFFSTRLKPPWKTEQKMKEDAQLRQTDRPALHSPTPGCYNDYTQPLLVYQSTELSSHPFFSKRQHGGVLESLQRSFQRPLAMSRMVILDLLTVSCMLGQQSKEAQTFLCLNTSTLPWLFPRWFPGRLGNVI